MRTFTIIWFGQLVSTIGSYMTGFAMVLWAWQLTGSATALALVGFFSQLPRIVITVFSGILVDRFNRKHLMLLGDTVAALSTIALLTFYLTNTLQIWHLYLLGAVNSSVGELQNLAYSTSLSLIVPPQHYTRASSMGSAVHYGSNIFAPALAGSLYPMIGLVGILLIDLSTFGVAIATLLFVVMPQPPHQENSPSLHPIGQTITFGFKYMITSPRLRLLACITALFWFMHDLGGAIYDPMILARSDGSAQVLASTSVAAGVGGVTGAIVVSLWGGFKRRMHGLLGGMIGAGMSKTLFGLGQSPTVWIPAQFCSSLNFPLLSSSETAIWMAKVAPEIQGRVFAANSLVLQVVSSIGIALAGPLADRVFEPAMSIDSAIANGLGSLVGNRTGAGMAILYILCSIGMTMVGVGGYFLSQRYHVEDDPETDSDR